MVSVSIRSAAPAVDVLIYGVRDSSSLEDFDVPFEALGFRAEAGQTVTVPSATDSKTKLTVYVTVADDATCETLRTAVARGIRASRSPRSVAVDFGDLSDEELVAVTESIILTTYRFDQYRSQEALKKSQEKSPPLTKAVIVSPRARQSAAKAALTRGTIIAEAVNTAREWVNIPGGDLRPPVFAKAIEDAAHPAVKVSVWDEKRLAREKCGGILSVGQGSQSPPRLVKLEYSHQDATTHLALVGKGITFDSGGLSIKTGVGMQTMKCDMAGAATVVAAINIIAELELPITVTVYACLAENLPSGSATRPGDVITMRNKKTVEVLNTDAEGRMVLGDGLALANEAQPDWIVDVATLTGAAMAALGQRTAAILGNNEEFETSVSAAAKTAGEAMWRLPITEEISRQLSSSNVADLRQIGTKSYGGALFAAAFLREFVGDSTWAHLDIAGPSFNDGGAYDYTAAGGTGFGVRTLVELADSLT